MVLNFLVETSGEFTPLTAYEDNAENDDDEDSNTRSDRDSYCRRPNKDE